MTLSPQEVERIRSRYQIISNGDRFKVQRRNALWIYFDVCSTLRYTRMDINCALPEARTLEEAQEAMEDNIQREIKRSRDWQVVNGSN